MANRIADPNGFSFTRRGVYCCGLRARKDNTKFDFFRRLLPLRLFVLVSRIPR